MLARLSGLKVLAHRRALLLRNTIKSRIPTERQHIEERYNELHYLIVKAIDIKKKLQEVLKIANEKSCSTLDGIEIAIQDAQAEKKTFEDAVGQYEKRDVRQGKFHQYSFDRYSPFPKLTFLLLFSFISFDF